MLATWFVVLSYDVEFLMCRLVRGQLSTKLLILNTLLDSVKATLLSCLT